MFEIKYFPGTKQMIKEIMHYIYDKEIRIRLWYGEKGKAIPYRDIYVMGYILLIEDYYCIGRAINQERELQRVLTHKIVRIDDTVGKITIYKDDDFDEGHWDYFYYRDWMDFKIPETIYQPDKKWVVSRNGEFFDIYNTKKEAVYKVEFELGLRYDVFS